MDRINELLARLADLSAEELAELNTLILAEAGTLAEADATAEVVAALSSLGDAREQADAESTRREEAAAALAEQREAALARLRPAEATTEADADATTDAEAQVVAEAEQVLQEEPLPVAASAAAPAPRQPVNYRRPQLGRAASRAPQPPATPAPARGTVTLYGAGGADASRAFEDQAAAVRAFGRALERSVSENASTRRGGPTARVEALSAVVDFPEDRYLSGNEVTDSARVDALIASASTPDALVAAGGLCAPLVNLYDVNVIGVADRPIRDSFPSMGAERGGVSLRGPVIPSDMAGAIGTWSLQNDIDASTAGAPDPTKAYATAICAGFTDYTVSALTEIVEFNNVTSRFDPEMTQAIIDATAIAYAKKAENSLLTQLNTFLTPVTQPKTLGAIADSLAGFDRTLSWWKTRRRLSDAQRFHAYAPRWVRDMFRADMVRSLFAKGVSTGEAYALTDATIDGFFRARNVTVTWHLDGRATAQSSATGVPAIAAQDYASASLTAAAASPEFPDTIEWQLILEGDAMYLDGGEINLGTVRDSTLNATNKFRTFREEFYGLAWRGADGLQLVQTLDPNGLYAGWVDTSSLSD